MFSMRLITFGWSSANVLYVHVQQIITHLQLCQNNYMYLYKYTVKREYLVAIIFSGFSNMTIWQRINLGISNTAIYKNCNVFIWRQLILANFLNSPISPNKSLPIINRFTVYMQGASLEHSCSYVQTCTCTALCDI